MQRILLFVVAFLSIYTHPLEARVSKAQDSLYIRRFPGTFTIRTYLGEKLSIFDLVDKVKDRDLQYRPNNVLALGLGVTVHGFGVNFSTSLPFHDKKEDLYGKTKRLDVQLHKYSPLLMLDGYFQRYQGFHLNSTADVFSVPGPTIYPYFPDMRSYTLGASALYAFNGRKFSMRSMVSQQDWQLKSAGSPLLGAAFYWHQWKNEGGILPQFYKYTDFLEGHQPRRVNYYGFTVNAGYGYTAVFKQHFFGSLAADIGGGPGYSSVHDTTGSAYHHIGLNITADVRAGFGYNSTRWYAGVYGILHGDRFGLPYSDGAVSTGQGLFRVVIARRLRTGMRWLSGDKKPRPADIEVH